MDKAPKVFVRTTAQVRPSRVRGRYRWLWLLGGAVVVAAAVLIYAQRSVPAPVAVPETDAAMTDQALDTAINRLYNKQDFGAAVKLAEVQNQKRSTPHRQLVLATAYSYNLEYDKAFALYDALDRAGQLPGSETMTAAQVAQLAGDKARAISYFQKAQARIQAQPQDFATKRELIFIDQQLSSLQR